MEFVNKIKKKLADAKRERYYRKGQLPWQLEGMHRDIKEYMPLENAKSVLIYTDMPDTQKLQQFKDFYNYCKDRAIEVLFVHYLPEGQEEINIKKLPKNIKLQTIQDENLSELGEVSGPYLQRLKAKNWDLVILDLDDMNMPIEYLLHLTKAKCIISDSGVNHKYPDVQYSTERTAEDNIIKLVQSKLEK